MAELVVERTNYYPSTFVFRIVNALVGIVELALIVRFVLELFAANSSSSFVAWVYGVTAAMVGPFAGAFPGLSLGGNSFIDIAAVLAMIVYAVLGWLVIRVLSFIFASLRTI